MTPDFWRGRRVFVTGHTGFKGAWLCLWLERLGAQVQGYALAPPTQPSLFELADASAGIQSIVGDVRDLSHLSACLKAAAPEIVLHMAAQSVVLSAYADPVDTYATNVMGTVNVLEAVRRAGKPMAVVNVTTDKAYHNQGWLWSYRENDALGGRDPYSNSKACSELVTQSFRESFFPTGKLDEHGVAIASARAGNVVGGGDWTPYQLVPAVVAAAQRGKAVALRNPAGIRPWQHVLDCLRGYLTLAERLCTDPRGTSGDWNFGPPSDDVYTVAQVAELLAHPWGVDPAWTSDAQQHAREEHELRLDCSKAARHLGWRCSFSTPEALAWVARWYLHVQAGRSARDATLAQIDAYLARLSGGPARNPAGSAP